MTRAAGANHTAPHPDPLPRAGEGEGGPHQYIYLCFGKSPTVQRELRYSIETLLAEIGGDSSRITIFTDRPQDFADRPERFVDISADLAEMTWGKSYMFRAKPG